MGEIQTIKETDFLWVDEIPQGVKKAVLYDCIGTDMIPAVVGSSLIEDEQKPIGYISSKHIHASPHTLTDVGFTGWCIFRTGDTIIIEIMTPAHLSNDPREQKNAWLFNYPPARDIAEMLREIGVTHFYNLTSSAFNTMAEMEMDETMHIIEAEDIGDDDTHRTLQPLWGWLPSWIFGKVLGGQSKVVSIPPAHIQTNKIPFEDTGIPEALNYLVGEGIAFNGNLIERAMRLYTDASSENMKTSKEALEMIAKEKAKRTRNNGVMFG